eukprot:Hpha_TRINITY_DN15564_c1_g2::TRINITY_DN15564_c1_g2_i1::g.107811::m.107811
MPGVSLVDIRDASQIASARELCQSVLPVPTPPSFWSRLKDEKDELRAIGAESEGEMVGVVVFAPVEGQGNERYVHLLGVRTLHRGEGVGSALLHAAVQGSAAATLHVQSANADAISFYRKNGFEREGAPLPRFYRHAHQTEGLLMRWKDSLPSTPSPLRSEEAGTPQRGS